MFVIVFQQGPLKGRRATVRGAEATLGPGRDCDVHLPSHSTLATVAVAVAGPGRYRLVERSAIHELRAGGRLTSEAEVGPGEAVTLGTTVFTLEPLEAGATGVVRRQRPLSASQALMLAGMVTVIALQVALVFVFSRIQATPIVSHLDDPVPEAPPPVAETAGTDGETDQETGAGFLDPRSALLGSWRLQEAQKGATNALDAATVTDRELVAAPGTVTSAPPEAAVAGPVTDTNAVVVAAAGTATNESPVETAAATTNEVPVVAGTEPKPPAAPQPPTPAPATNAAAVAVTNAPPTPPTPPPSVVDTHEPMTTPVGPEVPAATPAPVAPVEPPAAATPGKKEDAKPADQPATPSAAPADKPVTPEPVPAPVKPDAPAAAPAATNGAAAVKATATNAPAATPPVAPPVPVPATNRPAAKPPVPAAVSTNATPARPPRAPRPAGVGTSTNAPARAASTNAPASAPAARVATNPPAAQPAAPDAVLPAAAGTNATPAPVSAPVPRDAPGPRPTPETP